MSDDVVITSDVQKFFHGCVVGALENQHVDADAHTVLYIVNLLGQFARSEHFYDKTQARSGEDERRDVRPLALQFADALDSRSDADRLSILKRLGDISLYIAGFFSPSLHRKTVGVDYYINMGGSAYGSASDMVRGTLRGDVFGPIFEELAQKFECFVDVLGEVSERSGVSRDSDILRLYETWLRTGSPRAEQKLSELGIHPTESAKTRFEH